MPTDEEYLHFKKVVAKHIKRLEGLIDDAFDKINANDDRLTQNVDEAIDHAKRAQRAVARLKKTLE